MGLVESSTNNERQRILSEETITSSASDRSTHHGHRGTFSLNCDDVDALKSDDSDNLTATTPANGWSLRSLVDLYAEVLEDKPLLLKSISSGLLAALGDLISQCIFWTEGGDGVWHNREAARRTFACAMDGVFFNAPFLHFAYGALDQWMPAEASTCNATMQVVIDVFVLDPVYALIFIFTTGFFEGKSAEGYMIPTIKQDYVSVVFCITVAGLVFSPVHVYLFKHLSLKWRVLIADGMDVLWTIIVTYIIGPGD